MQARTLERLRWLSVVCLAGSALMFVGMARDEEAADAAIVVMPAPAMGGEVLARLATTTSDVPYRIEMTLPLAPAEEASARRTHPPDVPAALRAEFRSEDGESTRIDVSPLRYEYLAGDGALFASEAFALPRSGTYDVSLTALGGALPPGRMLTIAPVDPLYVLPELTSMIGWTAFAAGSALWSALAFARRYAVSDAP
jgi:hypothetical protein